MNPSPASTVARHALGWLVAANGVGVLLAALLLWPAANSLLAPLTYGRWVPLHLDWQLYGWCSLPLIGGLIAGVSGGQPTPADGKNFRFVLRLWSAALLLGGVSWLGGTVSGKLYLDWAGWARPLLPLAMGALWAALAARLWQGRAGVGRGRLRLLTLLLDVLAAVPVALFLATSPATYPAINPDSGGATGTSLLGSNLALVAIAGLLPPLLRLPRRRLAEGGGAGTRWFWPAWGLSVLVFLLRPHGEVSHHRTGEVAALGVVLAWVPLTIAGLSAYVWPAAAGRWLRAAALWWAALVLTGWLIFLPGFSEAAKFTHLLVAHSHLALAGLVSSMNGALLAALGFAPGRASAGFPWWQGAAVAHILVLLGIGVMENADPAWLWSGDWTVTALFAARLAIGLIQFGVSLHWLRKEWA